MQKFTIVAATSLIALVAVLAAAGFGRISDPNRALGTGASMPSIEELHVRADVKNIPIHEVKEPF
jgi:hypothetical protein